MSMMSNTKPIDSHDPVIYRIRGHNVLTQTGRLFTMRPV